MMKKYTFDEQNGLWYEQCGEYRLPCLIVRTANRLALGDSATVGIFVSTSTVLIPLYRAAADRQAGRLFGEY